MKPAIALPVATSAAITALLLGASPAAADEVVCSPAPGESSYLRCTGPAGNAWIWTPVGGAPDTFAHLQPSGRLQSLVNGTVLRDQPDSSARVVTGPGSEFYPVAYLASLVEASGDRVTIENCTSSSWTMLKDPATGMLGWAPTAAFEPVCSKMLP